MDNNQDRKRVTVDLNKYKCVKILLESGATHAEITEMTGCSSATISRIRATQTFEEYKQNAMASAAAYAIKVRQKQAEEEARKQEERLIEAQRQEEEERKRLEAEKQQEKPVQTDRVQSNYQMNRLIEIMKEQNDILRIMSNKIAFIVDELTK